MTCSKHEQLIDQQLNLAPSLWRGLGRSKEQTKTPGVHAGKQFCWCVLVQS